MKTLQITETQITQITYASSEFDYTQRIAVRSTVLSSAALDNLAAIFMRDKLQNTTK